MCVCVCVFVGKGRGEHPHMHGHKESYKDLNLKIGTHDLMNTSLTLYQLIYQEHMCMCVCFFFVGKGRGGTPYARTQGEL